MRRLAFVTDELPRPGVAGHLALNHAILSWLVAEGHDVILFLTGRRLPRPWVRHAGPPVQGPQVRQVGNLIMARFGQAQVLGLGRAVWRHLPEPWRRRLKKPEYDAVLGSFIGTEDAAWCARRIAALRLDGILIDTIFRAPLLQHRDVAGIPATVIAHDVFHRRHAALTSAGYRVAPDKLSRRMEAELLAPAAAIAAMQPEEAAVLRTLCPRQNVFTIGMPAKPCPLPAATARLRNRLVFVGSASLPNLDGLRWFFAQVWPLLRQAFGADITLDLVGDCAAALPRPPAGVTRVGRTEALTPWLHRASLAIAPLRIGSGLKIKLLDYARHGLITVATPEALEGFAADPTAPFIRAGGATSFSQAVMTQLGAANPEDARALLYVARHYGPDACFAGLRDALAYPAATAAARLTSFSPP